VVERRWAPDLELGTHAHPFAVDALVVDGELALTCNGSTRALRAGDAFELAAGVPHAERYGRNGAVVWVARRHASA
jgi:quercetin dioxygenase-like cupin family protein